MVAELEDLSHTSFQNQTGYKTKQGNSHLELLTKDYLKRRLLTKDGQTPPQDQWEGQRC